MIGHLLFWRLISMDRHWLHLVDVALLIRPGEVFLGQNGAAVGALLGVLIPGAEVEGLLKLLLCLLIGCTGPIASTQHVVNV